MKEHDANGLRYTGSTSAVHQKLLEAALPPTALIAQAKPTALSIGFQLVPMGNIQALLLAPYW
jgi:hypothetical protein